MHPGVIKLVTTCEEVLVKAHSEALQEEFQRLLDADREDDLQRMYNLLHRIDQGLDPLRTRFEEHVKKAGLDAVERVLNPEKEGDVVSCLAVSRSIGLFSFRLLQGSKGLC